MAGRNQGEGDRESARRHDEAAQKFIRAGKASAAAARTRRERGRRDREALTPG